MNSGIATLIRIIVLAMLFTFTVAESPFLLWVHCCGTNECVLTGKWIMRKTHISWDCIKILKLSKSMPHKIWLLLQRQEQWSDWLYYSGFVILHAQLPSICLDPFMEKPLWWGFSSQIGFLIILHISFLLEETQLWNSLGSENVMLRTSSQWKSMQICTCLLKLRISWMKWQEGSLQETAF